MNRSSALCGGPAHPVTGLRLSARRPVYRQPGQGGRVQVAGYRRLRVRPFDPGRDQFTEHEQTDQRAGHVRQAAAGRVSVTVRRTVLDPTPVASRGEPGTGNRPPTCPRWPPGYPQDPGPYQTNRNRQAADQPKQTAQVCRGAPGRTRTCDRRIRSVLSSPIRALYQQFCRSAARTTDRLSHRWSPTRTTTRTTTWWWPQSLSCSVLAANHGESLADLDGLLRFPALPRAAEGLRLGLSCTSAHRAIFLRGP